MDFGPLPVIYMHAHTHNDSAEIKQLQPRMLVKCQPHNSKLMCFMNLCFVIFSPVPPNCGHTYTTVLLQN